MPLRIVTVPCLKDNYAFVLHDQMTGLTAVVDVPEAGPIEEVLDGHGWNLSDILITHHHPDHINGVERLHKRTGARVIGARADKHRLPPLDLAVDISDVEDVCGEEVHVLDVPGHTVGHVAYWMPGSQIVFTGDSLMALGCGRLFEGTPAQMWDSLTRLRALPPETTVCSGHEYTESNGRFAVTVDPENSHLISRVAAVASDRAAGRPTVPSTLADEIATNPFLRADVPALGAAVGLPDGDPVQVFAEIRSRKDRF